MALPDFHLGGRTALVTGASSGLGRHFARTLAAAGAAVAVAARRVDKLDSLVDEIVREGGSARAVALDVNDAASVRAAFDAIAAWRGAPDVIVNNAGVAVSRPLLELAGHGIRVNAIAPGYVATELNRDFLASNAGQRLMARIPQKRFGDPADLDGPPLLLASEAGRFMTGSVIAVDGGHLVSSL